MSKSKIKIALLDDSKESLRVTEIILKRSGFEVTSYLSLSDAEADLQNGKFYDLLISDYHLGLDCNGVEALNTFRSYLPNLVSALISGDDCLDWQLFGFDMFLFKPLNFSIFGDQIMQLIENKNNQV